ncbi:hypothetical protein C0J50_8869 [Silurus asotus]|uniref:Motilin/ghrelin-associated peptide domain-containing protein n=1 Tax=Silurus asotus TaxID=30991 RepID=A0AAD5FFL9_SILAS|nr:hypothetical protein C0J50_8869 [Silurus asotus]
MMKVFQIDVFVYEFQNRGDRKPPRVGRRTAAELEPPPPTGEKIMASAPFQLAVSLSETEYMEYGPVLHKMLLDVLGDPPAWGLAQEPSSGRMVVLVVVDLNPRPSEQKSTRLNKSSVTTRSSSERKVLSY